MRRIGRLRSDGVAIERRQNSVASYYSHHQPRAGAGIAEIEGLVGVCSAPMPLPRTRQAPYRPARSRRPAPAGLPGAQHVVAFEQALDTGFAEG